MKKISFITLIVLFAVLQQSFVPAPVATAGAQQTATVEYHVSLRFVNEYNGSPWAGGSGDFYLYAYNVNTGAYYEFDYYEDAFLLPPGTYYFRGDDASGAGWIGAYSGTVQVTCNTTVTMKVWAE
jgi:hypothetical protein